MNLLKTLKKEMQSFREVVTLDIPRSNNEIVEEIHETFFTEVDRLLAEAKISNSLETDKQHLLDKCERLRKLGFSATREMKDARLEVERLNTLRAENETKAYLIEAITYFNLKYPHYKFITEDSVMKICEKYGLIYGEISRYIGNVPDKNLEHIENFKISEEDELHFAEAIIGSPFYGNKAGVIAQVTSNGDLAQYMSGVDPISVAMASALRSGQRSYFISEMYGKRGKSPLEICAPKKDFNLKGAEIKGNKITKVVPPDPIVLCPVIFKGKKHYLVVTAWGLEASDENVVNQKMN